MKKWIIGQIAAVTAALTCNILPASGADILKPQGTVENPAIVKQAQSPWQIRLRALGVIPRDKGRINGEAGSDLEFSRTVIPELDISYYITDQLAAELILGTTYSSVNAAGSASALGKLGRTWLLPPTLTLQYHFTQLGNFKPYIGAGVNYTVFYKEKGNHRPQGGNRISSLNVDNTWGLALQVGADYMLNSHWGVNLDVKKLFLRPSFNASLDGAPVTGKARLDPWLIGAGVTYHF